MNKQGQIEEMAVIGCVRNPQAHTAEECAKCDFKQGMCNAYRHAEALYNAGYRKISEGTLVLTKEELVKMMESGYVYETTSGNKINIIEMAREIERKETAKEILQMLQEEGTFTYDYPEEPHSPIIIYSEYILEEIEEKYGVEVEE